jgi:hypothetical protein
MKTKKLLRYSLIVLGSLLVVVTLSLIGWSKIGTYPAHPAAQAAMESSDQVAVSQGEWITFTPQQETDTGLIFYPGGLVEPAAYASVLHQIAEQDILVVITPMPLNLAIFKVNAANKVIQAYPEISTWVLAGHSLGGAAASIYAENNPTAIDGLALWDSYPPGSADLSDNNLTVLSIYGTKDGAPNPNGFDEKRSLLPVDAQFDPIEGASHAQFGDYGPQKGDVEPTISLTEQHQRVVGIMLKFIAQLQ